MKPCKELLRAEATLGAILELLSGNERLQTTMSVIPASVEAICRTMEIDPREMRKVYNDWQAGEYDAMDV